jgi:hypothetical protein
MSNNTAIFIILIIISTSVPILAIGKAKKMCIEARRLHKHEK